MKIARAVSFGIMFLISSAPAVAEEPVQAAVPVWLSGEWSRDWIRQGKLKTNTLDVHYLQTPTYFADMRIPKNRLSMSGVHSLSDLTDRQLRSLTKQSGFTGLTTLNGPVARWHHDIEYQPSDGTVDEGRLQRLPPNRMHEQGLDGSYTESWKSGAMEKGSFW